MKTVIPKRASPSNPYLDRVNVVMGDVTTQAVDAVVSVIPKDLEYRGSLNAALLKVAGAQLDDFIIENVYRPQPADVYAVPGFNLPCKYLLFGILPVWKDSFAREDGHVLATVRKIVEMASRMDLDVIAIPPIASGGNGLPKARAIRLIVQGIAERIGDEHQEIRVVCSDQESYDIFVDRLTIAKGG